ncbi:MAG: hypothetical protein E7641_04530 [Ruminococcaceae bacterium]|nr:hypothetical protein [Oscillospiraceae bacterium]
MANWDNIKANVSKAANKTAKKASELADIASLHFKEKTIKAKINTKFEKLGKLTYMQLKSNISQADAIAVTINEIDELRRDLKEVKAKIEESKRERKSDDIEIDDEPIADSSCEEKPEENL